MEKMLNRKRVGCRKKRMKGKGCDGEHMSCLFPGKRRKLIVNVMVV